MGTYKKNNFEFSANFSLKFFLSLFLCLLVRLIPFRVPNIEPLFATTMPMSRAYGAFSTFSFAVLSVLLYDVVTGTLGVQTFFTTLAYGLIALWSASYFKNKKGNTSDYVRFAIFGTLAFDAMTGLTVGPIFFHQSFLASLIGQIPFTILHLFGNVALAFILSPAIYHLLIRKKEKQEMSIIKILNPKTI